jgi:carboxypeptidase family protein
MVEKVVYWRLCWAIVAAAIIPAANAAGISGTVWDPSGAALPEAQVTVLNVETGIQRKSISNETGFYAIPFLEPGVYRMIVRGEGFLPATRAAIRLTVDQMARLDVNMSIASVTETIHVTSDLLGNQSSTELGTVIEDTIVESLPLNGRNFSQLFALVAGATPVSTSQGSKVGRGDQYPTGIPDTPYLKPSFHGQQNRSQIVYQDGIINSDFRSNSYAVLPNIDLLKEFKIQTHSDKVEWGGVTGGVINLVSRSGTNDFHGSGFWYVRNDAFDARDPFKDANRRSPTPFRQNQFGGVLGGPIVRNRTFFYGGYDGWRYRKPSQSFARVPTPTELAGDFSNSIVNREIYSPFSTRVDEVGHLIRDPFPGNVIPSSMISPMVQGFLEAYEERPNLTHPVYNFTNNVSSRDDANSFQIKVDHRVRASDSVFFRWNRQLGTSATPSGQKKITSTKMTADNYGGGWLHVFSPNVALNIRGGVARRDFLENLQEHTAGSERMAQLGFTDIERFGGLLMRMTNPWRKDIGLRGSATRQNPTYSVAGDLSWVKGNHSYKTGFQWLSVERLQINTYQEFQYEEHVTADPLQPGKTGASLASALLGLPVKFVGHLPERSNLNFGISTWSGYFQDEWQPTPYLTVNVGLRFDHNNKPAIHSGLLAGPDLDRGVWVIGLKEMPPPCNTVGETPCIPGNGLQDVPHGDKIVLADVPNFVPREIWDNWGPRVGIAYRIGGRTVIRGGYGLHWDTLISNSQYTQHNLEGRWPATVGFSGVANQLGEELTIIEDLQGRFPGALPEPSPWNFQGWTNDPDRKNGYSQQWNIELERQMTHSLMLSAAYVGSVNGRLEYSGLGNSAVRPGPGTPEEVDQRRPVPYMGGGIFYSRSIGKASYNGLQLRVRQRLSRGLQTMFAYTWSKSIDTGNSGWFGAESGPGGSAANQNYHDIDADRSVSSYNIPHSLSWYTAYELPLGAGKSWLTEGIGARILGNWQVNSMLQWRSGQPYNLRVSGDVANIGNERPGWRYARPNLVGEPRVDEPSVERYYNPEAFAIPQFEYGDFGRNVLSSDSVFNVDLSLFRDLPLGSEGKRFLQLRFEAFNVFNHIDWAPPETDVSAPGAGRVTATAHPPRVLQFGVRFVF